MSQAVKVVLAVLFVGIFAFGIYLLLFHDPVTAPFAPEFGHGAVGLGSNHWLHSGIGVMLLIASSAALYFLSRGKR